jgi:hypothetical protein
MRLPQRPRMILRQPVPPSVEAQRRRRTATRTETRAQRTPVTIAADAVRSFERTLHSQTAHNAASSTSPTLRDGSPEADRFSRGMP